MRSMLSRLTASTESHWSSLMRASVLSRVMPALWTTMSTPRSASTPGRAVGGDVELQRRAADPVGDRREVLALGRDVEADDVRAVARQHLGDRGADAARGAGDDRDLAGQRPLPVLGRVRGRGADADHLAGHVGGAAGEQEAQRRLEVGVRRRVDELRRRPVADLLGRPSGRSPRARAGRRLRRCRARSAARTARASGSRDGRSRRPRAGRRCARSRDASKTSAP